jgi:glycosyltransferase involved in cell wall biosynthesis
VSTTALAVVVSGFPRTSETFAVAELTALAESGMLTRIYATKPGDGARLQPGVQELLPFVRLLPPGDCETQAAAIAHDIAGTGVDGLHGYFAHEPTAVAAAAARRLGVGYSFSVHALDARKITAAELALRAREATGVIACNDDVAKHVRVPDACVSIVPHGVNLQRFRQRTLPAPGDVLRLLAVGRLVEKKGFSVLVDSVSRLRQPWTLRIIGDGPQREHLERSVARAGLQTSVDFVGTRAHDELPEDYAWADIVVVPSVVDSTGDRDGLPNVVLEAMASGRPLVAAEVSAIGPALQQAGAGVLVPSGDPTALAHAIGLLGADRERRRSLGQAGRRHVESHFALESCTRRLQTHLEVLHAPDAQSA